MKTGKIIITILITAIFLIAASSTSGGSKHHNKKFDTPEYKRSYYREKMYEKQGNEQAARMERERRLRWLKEK